MAVIMQCPFYKRDDYLTFHCEGAKLKFPDGDARIEHVLGYCANFHNWRKCPIAHYLENYHFRKEDKK